MSSPLCTRLSVLIILLLPAAVRAEDWPMFGRSSSRNAVSPESNPPGWWQVEERDDKGKLVRPAKNIKWSVKLGTHTKGEPIVANGLVWVGTNNGEPRDPKAKGRASVLMCFREKDGQFLYQYVTKLTQDDRFTAFAYAGHSSSPVVEGDRIWFTTMLGEVICLDIGPLQRGQGMPREVWKLDMRKHLGVYPSWNLMGWGRTCSISLPYKDFIYVQTGNGVDEEDRAVAPKAPSLVCLDKRTGKLIWSDNSPGMDLRDGQYSSPLVVEIGGQAQVIVPTGDGWVRSFDAVTGALIWKLDANPLETRRPGQRNAPNNLHATPVYYDKHVYVVTGNNPDHHNSFGPGWIYCIDPTKKGDISVDIAGKDGKAQPNPNSGVVWRFGGRDANKRARFTGALGNLTIHKGLVIAADQSGYVNCLDSRTGELYWKHDVQGFVVSTPLIADGKVYVTTDDGTVYQFALSKEKTVLGEVDVGKSLYTSAILANGVLYLATTDTLYAIAGTDKPPAVIRGHDWPQFGRDQTRNAVSPEKNAPIWWQVQERDDSGKQQARNIRWSAKLGSITYDDPVVVDGMVWIGTNNVNWTKKTADASVLLCLDERTGQTLGRYASPRLPGRHHDWPMSSMGCSPLIEGDRLWLATNRCEVVCLDIMPLRQGLGDAQLVWKVDMAKELGVVPFGTPMGLVRRCSLAGYKDLVFVITGNGLAEDHVNVPAPQAPSLACFNKHTGKVVWTDNSPGKGLFAGQWASPLVIEINGRAQVVAPMGDGWLRSFDALSGQLIWKFDTNPKDTEWKISRGTRNNVLATPVFADNRIYIGNGHEQEYGPGPAWLYCIDPTRTGDISAELQAGPGKGKPNPNSGVIWRHGGLVRKGRAWKFARTLSNVVVHRGLVVAPDIYGLVHCLDARTGEEYWTVDTGAMILGSPLVVDGKIYVGNHAEEVWILALDKRKKVLAKVEMPGPVRCSPIFANGVLYVVSGDHLYAIAGTEKEPGAIPEKKDRPRAPDAIFVPTPQDVVEKMLEMAEVKKTDVVYDLGCGDGRIVLTAARKYSCRAVGFDLDPQCLKLARDSVQNEKLDSLVTVEQKDLFTVDLSTADVVTVYLGERLNAKLIPQLQKLKPGARIVSHQFRIEGIAPDRVVRYRSREDGIEHTLYLWTVPLKKE